MKRFRALATAAMMLTFIVVTLGAYVRLKDAGLGCPDWPGCYGQLVGVPDEAAAAAFAPDAPLEREKAWIEVAHRYVAAILGLLVLALAFVGVRRHREIGAKRAAIAAGIGVLVVFQALLGMLTVTERLMPAVVTAHLLGGMTILALLAALVARRKGEFPRPSAKLRVLSVVALAALFAQVALGGWVSTNYAGLACPDFPLCNGGLLPPDMDAEGFRLDRDLGRTASGEPVTQAALATVHWAHRAGALVLLAVAAAYALLLWRESPRRGAAAGMLVLLSLQIAIGIANVLYQLPLLLAWAHNAVAAMLAVNFAVLCAKILPLPAPQEVGAGNAESLPAGRPPRGRRGDVAASLPTLKN